MACWTYVRCLVLILQAENMRHVAQPKVCMRRVVCEDTDGRVGWGTQVSGYSTLVSNMAACLSLRQILLSTEDVHVEDGRDMKRVVSLGGQDQSQRAARLCYLINIEFTMSRTIVAFGRVHWRRLPGIVVVLEQGFPRFNIFCCSSESYIYRPMATSR
jgi:hypothetical protein